MDVAKAQPSGGGVEAVGVVVDETGELGFTADTLGDEQCLVSTFRKKESVPEFIVRE